MGAGYAVLFVGAVVGALMVTPLVRAAAWRLDAVDHGGGRRVHAGQVPRLGGVALLLAAGAALLLAEGLGWPVRATLDAYGWRLDWLGAGALLMLLIGVADDVRGLGPLTKVALQTVAALLALQGGYGFHGVTNPFTGGAIWLGPFGAVATVLWIVGITNAFNLIDGLDGLAAGTGLIAALTLFLVSLSEGRPDAALLAITLAGALVGFLRFNFNPATIFLGDAGSLLLGYVLSVLSIQSLQKGPTTVVILVPILTLGLPIIEATVTIGRRVLVAGLASVIQADQAHIHHRLLDLGMTHRRAVLLLYAVCVAFGALAFLAVSARGRGDALIVAAVALAAFLAVRKLGYRRR